MNTGRNQPCPCGSGKKFKKCCLHKRQQASEQEIRSEFETASPDPYPVALGAASSHPDMDDISPAATRSPDPEMEAIYKRWELFEKESYDGQIKLFRQTLDEPELMDGEMAYQMLEIIDEQSIERGTAATFDALVVELRERLPEIYEKERGFFVPKLVRNAVLANDEVGLDALTDEIAKVAVEKIELLDDIADLLAYHGKLQALLTAMRAAWPDIRDSDQIFPHAIYEFANQAGVHEILHRMETAGEARIEDEEFAGRLRYFYEDNVNWSTIGEFLDTYADCVEPSAIAKVFVGPTAGKWKQQSKKDETKQQLIALSKAFASFYHREFAVPRSRAEVARRSLAEYLFERLEGSRDRIDCLCPHAKPLKRYLDESMRSWSFRIHSMTAFIEAVPAWLVFLQLHQVVSIGNCREMRADLSKLKQDGQDSARQFLEYPNLAGNIEQMWNLADARLAAAERAPIDAMTAN